jgi:hypothetical protein
VSAESPDPRAQVFMSMFAALSPLSKMEVHRQVVADVHGTSHVLVGVERERRLGALADLLGAAAEAAAWQGRVRGERDLEAGRACRGHHRPRMRDLPSVSREAYDARWPASAPSAEALCDEFGGWRRARAAAWAHAGHRTGHAWASAPFRSEPHSAKSARAAIVAFTRANGHLPVDPLAYWAWRRAEIDRARRAGKPRPDLPDRAALRNALRAGRGRRRSPPAASPGRSWTGTAAR